MRFGLLGAVTRGVRRYVIFSELNFVVPTLVKKSGPELDWPARGDINSSTIVLGLDRLHPSPPFRLLQVRALQVDETGLGPAWGRPC